MRSYPGFLSTLQTQLESLPTSIINRINRNRGLEISGHVSSILQPEDYAVVFPESHEPLRREDMIEVGQQAIDHSKIGVVLYAGHLDDKGKPLCLQKPFPDFDATILSLHLNRLHGYPLTTVIAPKQWIDEVMDAGVDSCDANTIFIEQHEVFVMAPDNLLDLKDGPKLWTGGPGDAIPTLLESTILKDMPRYGIQHIVLLDVMNLLAYPDPHLIGCHVSENYPVTCQVTDRYPDEQGGILCNAMGLPQIVESFKIYEDQNNLRYRATDTYVLGVNADYDAVDWQWNRRKFIQDGQSKVVYQRYNDDITRVLQTQYIYQPRNETYKRA